MASNPMQKKARNSFILGVIITLFICLAIGALLYVFLIGPNTIKESDDTGKPIDAYVLNTNVKAGQTITADMLTKITVYENMIPSNYIDQSILASLTLRDKDGNAVSTKDGKMYIEIDGKRTTVTRSSVNGKYYKGDEELSQAALIAKVAMQKNTILTASTVERSTDETQNNTRYVEYNMLTLGTKISTGDYVDLRVVFPNGQDLIIASRKKIESILGNTVGFKMKEEEIVMMESAIVEAYIMKSSKLYVTKYVEPGIQEAATATYVPTSAVKQLIANNPNILEEAKRSLVDMFNKDGEGDIGVRRHIDSDRNAYSLEGKENLEAAVQQEIENARSAREAYLQNLSTY